MENSVVEKHGDVLSQEELVSQYPYLDDGPVWTAEKNELFNILFA